jgi:hypothetical protein
MSRGQKCSICSGENVGQINALLASGIKLKDIAAQVPGLSPYALSRHKRNCLQVVPPATNGTGDALEAQIDIWLRRSEELYLAGGASLDLRAQAQSISNAFRALEFARKNQERIEEKAVRDLPPSANNWTEEESGKMIAFLDSIIREFGRTPDASPRLRLMGMESELEKRNDGYEVLGLFQQVLKDAALLAKVQTLSEVNT